jgi:hypothetical protein
MAAENDDPRVEQEAEAAAREAGAIGGRRPADEPDDAERPVSEGGGGESEGFEEAEEELRAHAEHADGGGNPLHHLSEPEEAHEEAAYGEADRIRSTETETETESDSDDG